MAEDPARLQLWIDAARSTVSVSRSWDRHQNAGPRPARKSVVELPESVLVKDALHALQGVPAAIKRFEVLSASFNLQAADKSVHNVSTLWASSVSTSALAKVLSELAFAGTFRSKLEIFVKFFTGTATKSRRKNSHGLINQAFAGAVQAILLGHTASLNQLLQSARSRQCTHAVLDDEQGGPLFGYEHGALSLLELYLHTEELRLQLQALTRVCLIQDDRSLESPFGYFPKGAEVLSHLYNLLVEPDPVHLELLRFLFARTCQPYVAFVRSCIYGAALKDPYGEFIVKQTLVPEKLQYLPNEQDLKKSTFKVRLGVPAPVFLVETCTQLLRTGQQLEVLLKLPQTREFAQNMATLALSAKPFDGLTVAFEKHGLAQLLYERNARLEAMKELYSRFFGDAQPTSQIENGAHDSEELPPESANADLVPSNETAADLKAISPSSDDPDSADDASVISEKLVTNEASPGISYYCQDSRDVASNSNGIPRFCFEDTEQLRTFDRSSLHERQHFEQPWLEFGLPQNPFISCNSDTDSHGYAPTLFTETNVCWDVRSSDINEEGLLKKLVPELTQVKGFLSLSSSAKTKPLSEALNNLLKQDVAVLVPRVQLKAKVHTAVAGGTCQMELQTANATNSPLVILKQVPARGGGSWEVSLRYTEGGSFSGLDEQEIDGVDDEGIPISVVVDRCIVQEILAQYRFVSASTVRVFQDMLCLQQHYLALRRYYFMEVGDWADNFVTSLGHHQNTARRYRRFELQGILEASLQKSSCDGDSYGDRLYIAEDPAASAFGRSFSLEACDSIELGYRVDWPLNLVLTPDAFSQYRLIFKFLLRLRLAIFALAQISQQLQTMERAIHRERTPSSSQNGRFRVLQLFRHQIGHFVTAVQCHVQSQLLHVVWSKFLRSMQDEVKDMHDLGVVHLNYLKDALHQCFLSSELSAIKICIDNIMQCLLDFRLSLLVEGIDRNECGDRLYSKSLELKSSFQQHIQNLRKSLSVESGYLLPEFHMILDYNGFFSGSPT